MIGVGNFDDKIIGNTTGLVSTGALVAGAATYLKDVGFEAACKSVLDLGQKAVDGAMVHPVAAGLTALAFGIKLHKKVVHNTPKMYALATITTASLLKDRRLDQLTESNNIKAANQLRDLRLGQSI